MASRAARSSLKTRTLIRPWALSAASISFLTEALRPSPPTRTTGSRWWASARWTLRWAGVSVIWGMGQLSFTQTAGVPHGHESQNQEQEGQQGVVERPRQRPLCEARDPRGVSRACRLQAQGNRRNAGADPPGRLRGGPGLVAGGLEPVHAPPPESSRRGRRGVAGDRKS